jgi:DNA repair exonuclease SbcCD ATPase subunit
MLDNVQLDQIRNLKSKIDSLVKTQNQLREIQDGLDDTSDERNDEIEEKIESIEETIEELKDEIVDIEDNPQGNFPQEIIDEKLQNLLNDVKRDPEAYLENYGLLAENFIDKDSFVQGVIDSDGYGMLSSYDGSYDISKVRGTDYYVMRID